MQECIWVYKYLCMCVHECIHVCVGVCMSASMHVCVYVYECMHSCVCVCVWVHMSASMHVCMNVCTCVCVYMSVPHVKVRRKLWEWVPPFAFAEAGCLLFLLLGISRASWPVSFESYAVFAPHLTVQVLE